MIDNSTPGMFRDFTKPGKTLVITFTGRWEFGIDRVRQQPFVYGIPLRKCSAKYLQVRDIDQGYYMGRLSDETGKIVATDVKTKVDYFRNVIKQSGCTNVVTMGICMGGHASVLFGTLLNADHVFAINLQTFIKDIKYLHKKSKSTSEMKTAYNEITDAATRAIEKNESDVDVYGNLTNLDYSNFTGNLQAHFSSHSREDKYVEHFSRVKHLCKLKITRHQWNSEYDHYNTSRMLRDTGKLDKILRSMVV